jgi:hypothetical protein
VIVDLATILRANVPPGVNGVTFLDRGSTGAFVRGSTFLAMLEEYAPGSTRDFTTGHNNLPRSHPKSSQHSYSGSAFTTSPPPGNLWEPGFARGAPAAEIIQPADYIFIAEHMASVGKPILIHAYLDWQCGFSEGLQNPSAPGYPIQNPALQDLQWYVDPDPRDLNGNPIPIGSMTTLDQKILENKRVIKDFMDAGFQNIVVNIGGEDWRGLGDLIVPPNTFPPWDISDGDPDSDHKYAWVAQGQNAMLQPLVAFVAAQGWSTRVKFVCAFLESVESGRPFPLSINPINRNRKHLDSALALYGNQLSYVDASCHYRGDWQRWLREPQVKPDGTLGMRIAFPVLASDFPGALQGEASYAQAAKWIRIRYGTAYPNLRFATMADSVGDAGASWAHDGLQPGDDVPLPLPPEQQGLIIIHMLIEKCLATDLDLSQFFNGISGDHGMVGENSTAGFKPTEGHCGTIDGVFTKMPIYHASKTFGPVLHKGATAIAMTGAPAGIVQLALTYREGIKSFVAIWLVNKLFHGALGSEIGDPQSFQIVFPAAAASLIVTNIRRFSASELDNPIVTGALTVDGLTVTVAMPAFSALHFIVELVTPPGPPPRVTRSVVAPRIIRSVVAPRVIRSQAKSSRVVRARVKQP